MNFFKIEEFTDSCRNASIRLIQDLPSDVGTRIVPNRKVLRHGTETRMVEFHLKDRRQPGLLDKKHFSYGVIYDPQCRYHQWKKRMGGPNNILVRFYANRQRIYDKAGDVIEALWQEMQKAEPVLNEFIAYQNPQMIGIFRFFDARSQLELEEEIYQGFLELIPYWHSRYSAVIDSYGVNLTKEEVKEIIAGRRKFQPSGPRFQFSSTEYCRHVPEWLRQKVFLRDGFECLKCGSADRLNADHIIPVANGGRTTIENLQTLCAPCNSQKGSRNQIDYRK